MKDRSFRMFFYPFLLFLLHWVFGYIVPRSIKFNLEINRQVIARLRSDWVYIGPIYQEFCKNLERFWVTEFSSYRVPNAQGHAKGKSHWYTNSCLSKNQLFKNSEAQIGLKIKSNFRASLVSTFSAPQNLFCRYSKTIRRTPL